MEHEPRQQIEQRATDLTKLARALYESAVNEQDKHRLELHRQVAVKLAGLINEAINEDGTLHPDLGLTLLLFIELKADGNDEAESDRKDVAEILADLERHQS